MFQHRQDDFITRLQKRAAVGLRDEVDAFGRAADEDDFLRRTSSQELLDFLPSLLVSIRRPCGQRVGSAMNVRVVVGVELRQRIDHALRLLSRRRIIEPRQRLAVHALIENGEVATDRGDIQRARAIGRSVRSYLWIEDSLEEVVARIVSAKSRSGLRRSGTDALHEVPQAARWCRLQRFLK